MGAALKLDSIHYTYEDYKHWDGNWELIDGIAVAMSPSPMKRHQAIASKIIAQFDSQLDECHMCEVLPEFDYKISEDTVVRPDIVLTCNETNEAYLTKAPEIIIEIVSKSTALRDEKYKFTLYEKERVKYYVLIYPDDLFAKVYKLNKNEYEKEGDFSNESYTFKNTTCKVSLDFKKVFERFRVKC